jgi:hypothetical protein
MQLSSGPSSSDPQSCKPPVPGATCAAESLSAHVAILVANAGRAAGGGGNGAHHGQHLPRGAGRRPSSRKRAAPVRASSLRRDTSLRGHAGGPPRTRMTSSPVINHQPQVARTNWYEADINAATWAQCQVRPVSHNLRHQPGGGAPRPPARHALAGTRPRDPGRAEFLVRGTLGCARPRCFAASAFRGALAAAAANIVAAAHSLAGLMRLALLAWSASLSRQRTACGR